MDIPVKTEINISVETLARQMTVGEIGAFLNEVALRLDEDFSDRVQLARDFADNTSEIGARFLTEIIAQRYPRRD